MTDTGEPWRTPRLTTLVVGLDTAINAGSSIDGEGGSDLSPG